jgi:hypothetical protein
VEGGGCGQESRPFQRRLKTEPHSHHRGPLPMPHVHTCTATKADQRGRELYCAGACSQPGYRLPVPALASHQSSHDGFVLKWAPPTCSQRRPGHSPSQRRWQAPAPVHSHQDELRGAELPWWLSAPGPPQAQGAQGMQPSHGFRPCSLSPLRIENEYSLRELVAWGLQRGLHFIKLGPQRQTLRGWMGKMHGEWGGKGV